MENKFLTSVVLVANSIEELKTKVLDWKASMTEKYEIKSIRKYIDQSVKPNRVFKADIRYYIFKELNDGLRVEHNTKEIK